MRQLAVICAALALLLVLPASAGAHAVVVATVPEPGGSVERSPERVVFRFNEPVESAFGALRVFDATGERVDVGATEHPGGDGEGVAVRLRPDLPDGSYIATYRVVSADSHPISGGFVFTVGEGGATPTVSVSDLIDAGDAGTVTSVALGVAKGVSYAAIAVAVGGVLFLLAVWLPALRELAGAGAAWRLASESFSSRLRLIGALTLGAGALAALLGLILQGASAGGMSFWDALDSGVIGDVLGTRAGTAWGLRLLDWVLLGGLRDRELLHEGLARLLGRTPVRRALPIALGVALALPAAASAHPGHGPEQVLVARGAFTLPKVTVGTGDTVLWLWSGPDVEHSVTADPGQAESFDSDPSGTPSHRIFDAYSHRFTRLGRFTYHCRIHPDTMRGEVEVVALPSKTDRRRPSLSRVRVRAGRLRFTVSERATVLVRIERRQLARWRPSRDFDVKARRGRNRVRLPLGALEPGSYRVRMTAYDAADNRSRTLLRRFRLA